MKRRTKIAIGVLIGFALIVVALRLSVTSIRIELPPVEQPKTAGPVFVGMLPDGRLTVDGQPTTLDALTQDVAARFTDMPIDQQRIMIRATRDVKYDHFMDVLNRLEGHGWTKIGLINENLSTEPKP
ncbi:ExbD/TolR family protein [Caulobacter segnis]